MRHEVLEEFFIPGPHRDSEGHILPAPPDAVTMYERLKTEWLLPHPYLPYEKPLVVMVHQVRDGQEGFTVRKEIMYLYEEPDQEPYREV